MILADYYVSNDEKPYDFLAMRPRGGEIAVEAGIPVYLSPAKARETARILLMLADAIDEKEAEK